MNRGRTPAWMRYTLIAAGSYNIAFGLLAVIWPDCFFVVAEMEPPRYPFLWQCIGMIVGVYGIGYLAASRDPMRHWPIVLVGLLGKILGPIGFVDAASSGTITWTFGYLIITNDLIWWIPFLLMLIASLQHHRTPRSEDGREPASGCTTT